MTCQWQSHPFEIKLQSTWSSDILFQPLGSLAVLDWPTTSVSTLIIRGPFSTAKLSWTRWPLDLAASWVSVECGHAKTVVLTNQEGRSSSSTTSPETWIMHYHDSHDSTSSMSKQIYIYISSVHTTFWFQIWSAHYLQWFIYVLYPRI